MHLINLLSEARKLLSPVSDVDLKCLQVHGNFNI